MRKLKIAAALLITPFLFTFCSEDESATPEESAIKYSVTMNTQGTTLSNARSLANEIFFEEGTLTIDEIDFEAEKEDEEVEYSREQLTTFNLVTGEASPRLPEMNLSAGTYEEIEMGLSREEGEEPTIMVNGTFMDSNNDSIPFRYEYSGAFEFEFEYEGNMELNAGNISNVIFQLVPADWFTNISTTDLEDATINNDGVIVISASKNTSIYDKLTTNVEDGEWEIEIEMEEENDDDEDDDDDDSDN